MGTGAPPRQRTARAIDERAVAEPPSIRAGSSEATARDLAIAADLLEQNLAPARACETGPVRQNRDQVIEGHGARPLGLAFTHAFASGARHKPGGRQTQFVGFPSRIRKPLRRLASEGRLRFLLAVLASHRISRIFQRLQLAFPRRSARAAADKKRRLAEMTPARQERRATRPSRARRRATDW